MSAFTKSQYELISSILWCLPEDICICDDAAGGMTNSSILIDVKSKKYIVRLPGKGSKELINRSQEYRVYNFLHNLKYDNLTVFISPDGMKITKYITNPRNCDPNKSTDVIACMTKLREFTSLSLDPNVEYFSLTANIDRYRELAKIRNHTPRQSTKRCTIDACKSQLGLNDCLASVVCVKSMQTLTMRFLRVARKDRPSLIGSTQVCKTRMLTLQCGRRIATTVRNSLTQS